MTRAMPIAVVVDGLPVVRVGLVAVLGPCGVRVAGETALGRDVVRLVGEYTASLVVIGAVADLPVSELVRRLKARSDPPSVLVMLGGTTRDEIAELLALDADGLILRSAGLSDIREAVKRIHRGERVVAPALVPSLVGAVSPLESAGDPQGDGAAADLMLTKREREVLGLLAEGRTNRELASAMYVTLATVKTHLAHIYTKLDAANRNEAIGRAIALGLIG